VDQRRDDNTQALLSATDTDVWDFGPLVKLGRGPKGSRWAKPVVLQIKLTDIPILQYG
jgi:hypothetical protein